MRILKRQFERNKVVGEGKLPLGAYVFLSVKIGLTIFQIANFPEMRPRHHFDDESVGAVAAHPAQRAGGQGASP